MPYLLAYFNNNIAIDKATNTAASKTSVAGQYLNIGNTYQEMGDYKIAV